MSEPQGVLVPDLSMLSVTLETLQGESGSIADPLRLRMLSLMHTPSGRAALRPMVTPPGQRRQIPSAVAPLTPTGDLSIATQVDALRSNHNDRLRANLIEIYSDRIPAVWRAAAERPARWSRSLGDVLADVWNGLGHDAWNRSRPAIDRELRRQEDLAGRGAADALYNTLSPRIGYADDAFVLDGRVRVPVNGRRIVLAPMISAPDSMVVENNDPVAVVIGYPLPGALANWTRPARAVQEIDDPLATVVGRFRADVLRNLDHRTTMSALAARLNCPPSSLTHHCNTLESAGLVERVRQGRSIAIHRTARGAALLDVFS
ncbi:helix-turn-helix domain-containing protein [Kribbella sp. NPDC051952]|uniref:helix-turn-helix domain-containing protein n=1 Tax=Kribbella sp. NPDC051952 TaxID=3154851 RepID=UPI003449FDBB